MLEKKLYLLPVFVIKNPSASLSPDERFIHYPWFEDRLGEHCAIVRAENVIEGEECLLRGDDLNSLAPALIIVSIFRVRGGSAGQLRDLDQKFIVKRHEDFLYLTFQEAVEKLRDAEWVNSVFGAARQGNLSENKEILVVNLNSGLFKRRSDIT